MQKLRAILFRGKVEQGKLTLDDKERFLRYIRKFEGKNVCLAIDYMKSIRTDNQNRYYWGGVVTPLADEFGYFPDQMHDALRMKFLTKYDDSDLPTIESSSRLSRIEMSEYIEKIRTWAMTEYNINLPTPEEYKLLHNLA